MQHFAGLSLLDIRIVEAGEGWQLRVPDEPVQHFASREQAKRAGFQRCRLAARSGQVVHMTIVEATPGPEFGQARTGLFYERTER